MYCSTPVDFDLCAQGAHLQFDILFDVSEWSDV